MTIRYETDLSAVSPRQLEGFFEGWPKAPTPETLLRILQASYRVVLAREADGRVIGFATAISDGVLSAYVPLLEVLASHRSRGVGSEMFRRLLESLSHLYMVDLVCDEGLAGFYERGGMVRGCAMIRRSYENQSGR